MAILAINVYNPIRYSIGILNVGGGTTVNVRFEYVLVSPLGVLAFIEDAEKVARLSSNTDLRFTN